MPTVKVTSAGSTATPLSISEAKTEVVTPPSVPLMGGNVSDVATIGSYISTDSVASASAKVPASGVPVTVAVLTSCA